MFDHVPSEAVWGDSTLGVPLIVGADVFCGAAAAAAVARMPTAASASITVRASFGLILMIPTPFSEFDLSLTTRMPPAEFLTRRGRSIYGVFTRLFERD